VTPFPWVADNGSLRSPAATLTKGVLYRLSYISPLKNLRCQIPLAENLPTSRSLLRVRISIVTRTRLFLRTWREQNPQCESTQQDHHQPTYLPRIHCLPG